MLPILAGVICAAVVNYLSDVLPQTRRLSRPACRRCGTTYEFLSYALGRPCTTCGDRRGLRTWLVLAALIGLAVYAWMRPHRMGFALELLVLSYFATVVVIDVEHRLILRPVSIAGGVIALGLGAWLHGVSATLIGGLAGLLFMLVLYYFGVAFSHWRARRARQTEIGTAEEALGGGDVILALVLGLLLGWPLIWLGLLLGVLLGGVIGLVLVGVSLARGSGPRRALTLFMPYAPAFIVSAYSILFVPAFVSGMLPK
jgi:hypothetical protein